MNPDHTQIRLLTKKRTGLLHLLFSRIPIIAALVIVQIAILLTAYWWLEQYLPYFTIIQELFAIVMIFYLFNCRMDYSAKLTWLMLLAISPIPGAIFLFFSQRNVGHRTLTTRVSNLIHDTKKKLPQDEAALADPEIVASGVDDLCHYLNRTGCFPLYKNTEVTYFPLGEAKFEAMLEELRKAEKFIFMEYFILDEGEMWGRILKVLADKAQEGVDVRVMYDGMCEVTLLSSDYTKRMEKLGIKCKGFSPITPFISTHYNYRDHRKILVIDGETAFNGGVNLADEYINKIERFGHWKDTAVMLKGDAVASFTLLFLQMWNIDEEKPEWDPFLAPPTQQHPDAKGFVMPYGDCPLDGDKVGEAVYMDILNRATTYVHIMTPYLILDNELETALRFAAQRGVDVKLILPGIPDKKAAFALAKTHYQSLVDAGVEIYEYTPGFVHAKVFVSDDKKGVVGTINLDYRSLYHHFECATYLYDTPCIRDMEADYQETLKKCRRVTNDSIRNEKLSYKLTGYIMKLIAPLM